MSDPRLKKNHNLIDPSKTIERNDIKAEYSEFYNEEASSGQATQGNEVNNDQGKIPEQWRNSPTSNDNYQLKEEDGIAYQPSYSLPESIQQQHHGNFQTSGIGEFDTYHEAQYQIQTNSDSRERAMNSTTERADMKMPLKNGCCKECMKAFSKNNKS